MNNFTSHDVYTKPLDIIQKIAETIENNVTSFYIRLTINCCFNVAITYNLFISEQWCLWRHKTVKREYGGYLVQFDPPNCILNSVTTVITSCDIKVVQVTCETVKM